MKLRGWQSLLLRQLPSLLCIAIAIASGSVAVGAEPAVPMSGTCASQGVGLDSMCRVDGVTLHFVDWGGKGSDLILLAGLDDTARIFDELAPLLAAHHHVVAVTRRGFGHSSMPATGYGGATLTRDLKEFLHALGMRQADLVGHSMSGVELTRLATDNPDLVHRLVYLDAAMDLSGLKGLWDKDPLGSRDPPSSALQSFPALIGWTQQLLKSRSPAIESNLRQSYQAGAAGLRYRTPEAVDAAVVATLLAAGLNYSHVRAPALAIFSDYSHADQVPPEASAALRAAGNSFSVTVYWPWQQLEEARFRLQIPCGQTIQLHDTGHYLFIERPQETANWINSFLASENPCHWESGASSVATQ